MHDVREMTFKGFQGVTLVAAAYGDARNRPVLLLHGGGQTRHAWGDTAQILAEAGYYALSFDLRGHGDSEWSPDGYYSCDIWARDIVQIASALDEKPVLVGASLGGLSAIIAVGQYRPDLAVALVLVDVVPRVNPAGAERIVSFMRANPEGFDSLEQAADLIASYTGRPRVRNVEGLGKNLRKGCDGKWRWHWDAGVIDDPQGTKLHETYTQTLKAAHEIAIPTLLVRGEKSDVVTDEGVRELQAAIQASTYVVVPDASHMVAGDDNNAFNEAVFGFLEQHMDSPN